MDLLEGYVFVGVELDREIKEFYVLNFMVKDRVDKESDCRYVSMEVSVNGSYW